MTPGNMYTAIAALRRHINKNEPHCLQGACTGHKSACNLASNITHVAESAFGPVWQHFITPWVMQLALSSCTLMACCCRLEAITMLDMDDLLASAHLDVRQFGGLLNIRDANNTLPQVTI